MVAAPPSLNPPKLKAGVELAGAAEDLGASGILNPPKLNAGVVLAGASLFGGATDGVVEGNEKVGAAAADLAESPAVEVAGAGVAAGVVEPKEGKAGFGVSGAA